MGVDSRSERSFCVIHLSGETQVLAQVQSSAGTNDSTVGVLASSHKPESPGGSDSWQAAVLVYNSDDNSTSTSTDDVTVSLNGQAAHEGTFAGQNPLRSE